MNAGAIYFFRAITLVQQMASARAFTHRAHTECLSTACVVLQRKLHSMYQSYFEEDPSSRTPPIPTAFLNAPGSRTGKPS